MSKIHRPLAIRCASCRTLFELPSPEAQLPSICEAYAQIADRILFPCPRCGALNAADFAAVSAELKQTPAPGVGKATIIG